MSKVVWQDVSRPTTMDPERFRIDRLLGRGGMGAVFLAYDRVLHRQVALKMMEGPDDDGTTHLRLLREARSAAALNHPNICTVFEVGAANRAAFIAMEYVEGRSLAARLAEGELPVREALQYGIQAADALAYAHNRGVIHRDLKVANAMIAADGRLKIVDFGLAHRGDAMMTDGTTMVSVLPAGGPTGTPYAMAPEQIRGDQTDARTDIWAFGVLLYEMLTATKPFSSAQPIPELFAAILRDSHGPLPPAVPSAVRHVVERCLEKDPARRYQTAAELRTALDAALQGVTNGAARIGAPGLRSVPWAAGAVLVMVVAVFAFLRMKPPQEAREPDRVQSLAILPLEDLSRDPEQAYFSDGMTEALITKLARIEGLRVVPRSAVTKYQATRRPPAEIARELGVDAIVDGTAARSGNRVRITVNLIDPRANRALWVESYERDLTDVLALQSEVTQAIAGELRVQLTPRDQARLAIPSRAVNPTAYDFYLRAVTLLERVNASDAKAAVSILEQAVDLDPYFADAFGALASGYMSVHGSYGPEEASRLEPKVRAAIDKALSLDPESADALAAQGDLVWDTAHGWRHEEAIEAHRKALALKPNFARSRLRLATLYNHVGLADMALGELAQSDDSPAVLMQKGLAFRVQGRHDLALAAWLAIPLSSRNTNHIGHIAWALAGVGRTEEAWSLLREIPPGTKDVNGMIPATKALLHAMAGEGPQAAAGIAAATMQAAVTRESHHATYLVALSYARILNREQSLRWLRFTAANGFPCYPLVAHDTQLDSMRAYPPFVQFLEESRTRWEGYRKRLGG